jgi:hypothetical protein
MNATKHQRASIGFAGGQVLAVRVTADALRGLNAALSGDRLWFDLELEDGTVALDLAQVAYVRVESEELRVGFGA